MVSNQFSVEVTFSMRLEKLNGISVLENKMYTHTHTHTHIYISNKLGDVFIDKYYMYRHVKLCLYARLKHNMKHMWSPQ